MLAKGVLDGLERLAGIAAKELVSEHLSDSRLRPGPAPVPVLVDERADAGLDTRAARELDGVLDVPKRPEDQDILGPVDPGAVCNRGAPSGETTLDGRPASALEPLRRILAVCLDEGVGDGVDEVGVRGHVALPCEALLRGTSMALSEPFRCALRPPASTPDGDAAAVCRTLRDEDVPVPSVLKGDGREMQEGRPEARSGCPGRLRDLWLQRNEGRKGSGPAC